MSPVMLVNARRCCPKCQSNDYRFRARKTVTDESGDQIETKYRCAGCSHEWRERVPAPKPADACR